MTDPLPPNGQDRQICIGVDVGGTFTDAVLTDGARTWRAKAPTTAQVGEGVLAAAGLAAQRSGRTLAELMPLVGRFGLGTTAVTNVLASRNGRKVGLITTQGFEELVPLSRGTRVNDDEGWLTTPPEVVSPRAIVGVAERIDRSGAVVTPLDPAEAVAAARHLVDEQQVEALAVSFLWSFLDPTHENQAVDAERCVRGHRIAVERVAPMQAFAFNLRRKQFQDVRVRQALSMSWDRDLFIDANYNVGEFAKQDGRDRRRAFAQAARCCHRSTVVWAAPTASPACLSDAPAARSASAWRISLSV